MNGLRETCHCGHDKASHYLDESTRPAVLLACLCTGCTCGRFADQNGPAPPKPRGARPAHTLACRCFRCKEFDAPPPDRDTDPYPGMLP